MLNAHVLAAVCVVVGILVSHGVTANRPRQRPGEPPERVCYHSNINRPVAGGMCGPDVPETISSVCRLYSLRQGKRSADKIDVTMKGPVTLVKRDAMKFLTKRDAFRDIRCECCYNTCTISEIQEYCDNWRRHKLRLDKKGKTPNIFIAVSTLQLWKNEISDEQTEIVNFWIEKSNLDPNIFILMTWYKVSYNN